MKLEAFSAHAAARVCAALVFLVAACQSSNDDEQPGADPGGTFDRTDAGDLACASNADCPGGFECRAVSRAEFTVNVCVALDASAPSDAGIAPDAQPDVVVDSGPGLPVLQVSMGFAHACVLLANGGVRCWGQNSSGQLGDGTKVDRPIPVDVVGLGGPATSISAGSVHTCALLSTGAVQCWGNNEVGGLGDGTTTHRLTPVNVVSLGSGVTAISAGGSSTCARFDSGALKCWGNNVYGQLGDGTMVSRSTPAGVVSLGGPALSVSAGGAHVCALLASGPVSCWGGNYWHQLGDGTTTTRVTPTAVSLGGPAIAVSAGLGSSSCAVLASGSVSCWGFNGALEVGHGAVGQVPRPVTATALGGLVAKSVAIGTCATLSSGKLRCWGAPGTATAGAADIPLTDVVSVSANTSACAVLATGSIRCWAGGGMPAPVIGLQ